MESAPSVLGRGRILELVMLQPAYVEHRMKSSKVWSMSRSRRSGLLRLLDDRKAALDLRASGDKHDLVAERRAGIGQSGDARGEARRKALFYRGSGHSKCLSERFRSPPTLGKQLREDG